ncbi:hypothetical protein [Rubellimicrobium roseum]|uniref:Uncharacterized protein n=1 Tax=Rubellimicrobium roseum TaxID=687525 RepID=A0A5C4N7W1_9RHOB|nr:hypothetical protein [Rubellimicrobium roseum]TNC59807.1 hypothetical protein FHG71_22545 [Rubellimicrobium roseum]
MNDEVNWTDIASAVFSAFALVLSCYSLYWSLIVDTRNRRRRGLLDLGRARALLATVPEQAEELKEGYHSHFAATGGFHSGAREKADKKLDGIAALAKRLQAETESLERRLHEEWMWALEPYLVEADRVLLDAQNCRDELKDHDRQFERACEESRVVMMHRQQGDAQRCSDPSSRS